MKSPFYFLALILFVCPVAYAQETPPIDAQKYHDALLKHPNNPNVFSHFYDAWIDAQSIESLEAFLKKRAETNGGIDYIILARYQLRRGQDPNALLSINKAIESLPNDAELLMERANLLIRSNNFATARNDLEAIVKIGNETLSIEASKLIGKSYLRESNPEAAILAWEKIITNHPKNEDLLEDLVELTSSAEQTEQALKYSEQLIAASSDPYKKALRLIRRGEILAKSQESDKAIILWSETLSQTGEGSWLEHEILAHIEQTYRRLDRIDLLASKFEELATANPRRLLIHRELAKLEASSGNIDSAIGRFREVLRRSPGELELREEFIRLLIDSNRFDDASAEIGKMLSTTPNNPELHLRLAQLAFQKAQLNPDLDKNISSSAILKSLNTALELLDPTEASGLRIANLMIQYELGENGENLLKQLASKPNATSTPSEALAAEYTRTKRSSKALEILTNLTKSSDPETILRATNAMAPLTDAKIPFDILLSRLPEFSNNNFYISALIQASLAAMKPAEAIPSALKLVRSSKLATEIQESTKLANAVITAAEKAPDIIAELSKIESLSTSEICLLASLFENQKQFEKSDALLKDSIDPILLRFHSSLLSIRGDFPAAIASLNRLAQTSSDNNASYFKELSDLQLRSGDTAAAIKTIEQWKITAPTDKTPWTILSRLQVESGNYKAALDTTRRALTRFDSDEDLIASLADLYQQTGDYLEAERTYWKLYDQAPDSASQSRWAARLSTLAQNRGNPQELKDKFLQRARSNQQSVGPIFALVEIARTNQNRASLLEYLYQALRIKPKDIDIRIQTANAEKDSGNFDKQIAILNEGIIYDSGGKIRTALAQTLIDQGQVIKGMHMLRALNGERASDPRNIESSAYSIANTGMIAEAIQYLEESLPPNPDWRIRFLLAYLLQKDGREFEATTILISLMEAKDEILGLIPNPNFERAQQGSESSPENNFNSLLNVISQEIYRERNSNRSSGNQQQALPASVEELHFRSKILLAFISNFGNPVLKEKITAAKINDLALITDIISCYSDSGLDYFALLEKHPESPYLIKMLVQQGALRDPNTGENYTTQKTAAIYQKLLELPALDQELRTQIILSQLVNDPKNDQAWNNVFALLNGSTDTQENDSFQQIQYSFQNLLAQQKANIPSKHLPKIREILLKNKSNGTSEISLYALLGELDPWIRSVNNYITENQQQLDQQLKAQKEQKSKPVIRLDQYGFYPQIPQINNLPLTSIPISYIQNISSDKYILSNDDSTGNFAAKDLIKHLNQIESPALRAWIAILADDQKMIEKTLSVKPSEIEASDFAILKIWCDIDAKRYPEACKKLLILSNEPSYNLGIIHWAKTSFLAILSEIPAEKRSEFLPAAREIIDLYFPPNTTKPLSLNNGYYPYLLQTCKNLGLEDLVAKFTPPTNTRKNLRPQPTPATNPNIRSALTIISSKSKPAQFNHSQRRINPLDRFNQLSSEGKNSAAAHEFFNYVQIQKKQGYELSYIISNMVITEEIRKEIISIVDPGKNPSLSKRLDFAEICIAFKENDTALTILRSLAAERPFDTNINIQLAFSLPEQEIDAAAELLKKCKDSPSFNTVINAQNQRIQQSRSNQIAFHYFSLITKFLEISNSETADYRAFNDINNQIYYFLSGNSLVSLPSLIEPNNTPEKETPEILKHREIGRKLTTAMLRHSMLAESAFRYIRAAKWIEDPNQIDELARATILLENDQAKSQRQNSNYLPEFSSAGWLCDRINQSKSQNKIIPDEFISSIEKNDPILATLFKSYFSIKTAKDIAKFWESGAMQEDGYQTTRSTMQHAILDKIATIPGATDYFISRIKSLSQSQIINSRSRTTGESNHIPLIRAAVTSCKNQNETTVNSLCKTIIHAVYGDNFDYTKIILNSNSQDYQLLNQANSILDSIFNEQSLDPVTAFRVFQVLDSERIPVQNYYWLQNIFQRIELTDPNESIKLLESIGFLNDASSWKPIAYSTITNQYDQITGASTYSISRNFFNETIIQSFNYRLRSPEFVTLLEQRKPQTFGTLVTAALLSNDTEQRERLMISAFKNAAPQIAKASPEQLEDFSFLTSYLPSDQYNILPQKLQLKSKERNDKLAAAILINIDQKFKQLAASPSINPFGLVDNDIYQLAAFDPDKAIETFFRAYDAYKANNSNISNNQQSIHQVYFANILSSLASDRKIRPECALKFYHAVMNGPSAADFSYDYRNNNQTHLCSIGSNLNSRLNSSVPKNIHNYLRPWYIANQLPVEYQNDALAAMVCFIIYQQNSSPNIDELTTILEKTEGLSEKTRELIINCSYITKSSNKKSENRSIIGQHLLKLLNDTTFSPTTRSQFAISALRLNAILALPDVAEAYANILSEMAKQDQSIAITVIISALVSINSEDIPAESIPHLKRISEAFWENANTPKSSGHPPIREDQALGLYLFAIKTGDANNAELLLPKIRAVSVGNINVITSLILNNQFDVAEQLLPDESSTYFSNQSIYHSIPLLEKLIEFSSKSKKSEQILHLECYLINIASLNQRGDELSKKIQDRKQLLATAYLKNPPKSLQVRCEILNALQSLISPTDPAIEKEICDAASNLDPKLTLSKWFDKYKINHSNWLNEQYPFQIICTAAMIHFLNGDPTLFNSTCEAFSDIYKRTSIDEGYNLKIMLQSFLEPAFLVTAQAVAQDKTKSFSKSIKPLRDLSLALSKLTNDNSVTQALALHDFITHWENQPEDLTKELEKTASIDNRSAIKSIAFPRQDFPFITSLGNIQSQRGSSSFGPNTDKLLIAILSKSSLGDILPTKSPWLNRMENSETRATFAELTKSPPETLSVEGRTLLKYGNTTMKIRGIEAIESYQSILKDMPDNTHWDNIRIECKLHLVREMILLKNNIPEIRVIFDSIDQEKVPNYQKSEYQNTLKMLKEAEAKPQ